MWPCGHGPPAPAPVQALDFFRRTSWSISLSGLRFETNRRSRAFSSSSYLSWCTSDGIKPPYRPFQR